LERQSHPLDQDARADLGSRGIGRRPDDPALGDTALATANIIHIASNSG